MLAAAASHQQAAKGKSEGGPARPALTTGLVEGLWQGRVVYGWAADPQDLALRPILRLMRGLEVLAESEALYQREDGLPGFQLEAPWPVPPGMLRDGSIRVRALLPGRHAAVTLPMSLAMLAELEAAVSPQPGADHPGWEEAGEWPAPESLAPELLAPDLLAREPLALESSAAERLAGDEARPEAAPDAGALQYVGAAFQAPGCPDPGSASPDATPLASAQAPSMPPVTQPVDGGPPSPTKPLVEPPPVGPPLVGPPVSQVPNADALAPAPPDMTQAALPLPLPACLALARLAGALRLPVFHLLVPRRADVLGGVPGAGLAALEAAAAAEPLLAADWVPLRHGFSRIANPAALWRQDGRTLAVEGTLALLDLLLAVLRLRHPEESDRLAVAARRLARAEVASLPRRSIEPAEPLADAGLGLIGQVRPETEPALPAGLFADLPTPRLVGDALPGLETWSLASAPLPWRVVVMAEPGLGGSSGPARLGWWLRHLVAECVLSEALHIAQPEAVLAAQPDLLLTLTAEPF